MYNYNSPIINNMGIGYNNPIPPNPMGNIVSVGNSGYISGNYNNRYISPFQRRQQEEAMLAQQREQQRAQVDMFKKLSKGVNNALGNEISEERLNEIYNPQVQQVQQDPEEQIYHHLMGMDDRCLNYNPRAAQLVNSCNAYHEQMEQRFPKDMTLQEFYEESYQLKLEMVLEEQKQQNKNLTKLYNRDAYSELMKMHGQSSKYFNSVLSGNANPVQNDNIDDLTVTISNSLRTEQQRRKEMFLQSIMNNQQR